MKVLPPPLGYRLNQQVSSQLCNPGCSGQRLGEETGDENAKADGGDGKSGDRVTSLPLGC